MKLKKYELWQHIDTGFNIIITAKNEDEALSAAEDVIQQTDDEEIMKLIKKNFIMGELNVVREIKEKKKK